MTPQKSWWAIIQSNGVSRVAAASASILFILLVWQMLTSLNLIQSKLLPSPLQIFYATYRWIASGEFTVDFISSFWRAILGFLLGGIIGLALGVWTGRSKIANFFVSPVLNVLRAFPPVALLPLFITFWGIGDDSKILSITFACVFPIWVNTHAGVSTVPIEYIRSARVLEVTPFRLLTCVLLPAALRSIINGVRISIAMSFIMLYVSELAGASSGLGYQIASSHLAYQMDKMFGALFVLGLTAAIADVAFVRLIRLNFPWLNIR